MLDRTFVPPRGTLEARKRMNDAIRGFFDGARFLEVETPIAVVSPGLEPHLDAYETMEVGPDGLREQLYLHTSPEYAMKKLLGTQIGCIYQLARVFRNGERSNTHAGEFTMLEWYRQPGTLDMIMDDVEGLVMTVAEAVGQWSPARRVRKSVSQAFTDVGLPDPLDKPDLPGAADDTFEDRFFRAFLEKVEPSLDDDALTILHGYPASMAALSRIDPEDSRRSLRFEVFIGKVELGNAFMELADPTEQRRRFEEDIAERRARSQSTYPVDERLLAVLAGIGESAGIAMGVDRLLMRCLGLGNVQDVIPFSPR